MEDLLKEEPVILLVPASFRKRFANYVIDFFLFCVLASFLLMALAPVYPLVGKIMKQQPIGLADQLLITFFYGFYMSAMEAVLKGKTIGKFVTGTRAVQYSGYVITPQTAFVRGLIRMIPFPFEQISVFSASFEQMKWMPPSPWHDRWSKSIVIDETKSALPRT